MASAATAPALAAHPPPPLAWRGRQLRAVAAVGLPGLPLRVSSNYGCRRRLRQVLATRSGGDGHGSTSYDDIDSGGSGSEDGNSSSGGGWRRRRLMPVLASMDEDAAEGVMPPNMIDALDYLDRDDFKEDSRRYFRTVFDFDRWAAHRSTRRYKRHVLGMLQSRMVRGLAAPLLYIFGLTVSIALYHSAADAGLVPEVAYAFQIRTTEPMGLTAFALSLLLVFRTNASYSRWLDARKSWGQLINRSRDLARQAITYLPPEEGALLELLCRWTVAFSRAAMCHLRSDVDAEAELTRVLLPEEAESVLAAQHRPAYCLQVLSETIKEAQLLPDGAASSSGGSAGAAAPAAAPVLSAGAAQLMDANLTTFEDILGSCERILRTPIPLSYTRHTSRFMMIWLTLLPFSLWDSCRWAMVPLCCAIAFLLLGIEEIGVAIEEPFSILPLEQLCDVLERNVWELHAMHSGAAATHTVDGEPLTAGQVVRAARRRRQRQREREQLEGWRRQR